MRSSHNERALHEYRRDKSCNWVPEFPDLRFSWGICKHKSLCSISFCFSVPCLSLYMPRAVAAYKYNQYGLMHIQQFYFKYYIFGGTHWDWELSWRAEAAAEQIFGKAEPSCWEIHIFLKYENETITEISEVHNKSRKVMVGITATTLFSHALTEQCLFWELMGSCAVQRVQESLHRRLFKWKMPVLSILQAVTTNSLSTLFSF